MGEVPGPPRRRILGSLSARFVLVTFAVALIAVLVTALVAVQVVQTVEENQARQALKAQAAALIASGRAATAGPGTRLAIAGDRFAVVAPDGTVTGAARASVGSSVVRALRAGRTVSTTTTLNGKDAVLVGIPGADGGGIVGVRKVADIAAGDAELVRGILLALVVGLAVATVAGVLLARLLGRPLRRVADGARALAGGRRRVPIEVQPVAEIEDIAQALRALDTALATSEDRQREFLLSVSHEIRTPLTAIRGYAEALADGVIPPEGVTETGRTLSAESERLRRFVDDLLELARLEADEFTIVPQRLDARDTVAAVLRAWSGASGNAGVALRAELPPVPLGVYTDEMRLRQILDGLVENALRVAPAGSEIVVTARALPRLVEVSVRDSGPGLTAEDAPVAFARGALHTRYRGARPVGTGLGLSIAHTLAGRLGATIDAAPAEGGGAVFRVALPSSDIPRADS